MFLLEVPIQPLKLHLPHRHQQSGNSLFKLGIRELLRSLSPAKSPTPSQDSIGVANIVVVNALIPGSTSSASMHQPSSAIWILASAYSWTEILSKPGLMGIQR